jgi:divalent metal cation (Fe/Co/Zn/Cd) transporter
MSKSLSVISSLVDSGVDLLTSLILLWADREIKIRDAYNYPGGHLSCYVMKKTASRVFL